MKEFRTEDELSQSYDVIWKNFILREEQAYYSWIADLLNMSKGSNFLDVACGAGFMLKEAAERGLKTFGVDISPVAVNMARKESPSSKIYLGSGENVPFGEDYFDFVTCLGSLEHYLNPQEGIKEISRILKKDGRACIVLPNIWYWFDCLQGMVRGVSHNHAQELERFYSKEEAYCLLEDNGLKIIKAFGYSKKLSLKLRFKFFEIIYNNLVRHLIPINASYSFVFVCQKETQK